MLDTDTCSYIMKRSNPAVLNRLRVTPIDDVCMSVVTRGQMIGANDLVFAAYARSLGLWLVTNNTYEFGRVKGLTLENWTRSIRRARPKENK